MVHGPKQWFIIPPYVRPRVINSLSKEGRHQLFIAKKVGFGFEHLLLVGSSADREVGCGEEETGPIHVLKGQAKIGSFKLMHDTTSS